MNNPFQIAKTDSQTNAIASSDAERAIQEVQAAMVIAKRFPRNEKEAVDRILNACTRPTLAESALYSYVRGGTDITGPSIRLMEAISQQWGNIQTGLRELSQENGVSTIETFAWDVETNTRDTKTFQVRHERHTRSGSKALTDPRDIYEMVANMGARRKRACLQAVIPRDVVEAAVNQCEVTLHAKADTGPEAIKKMCVAFEQWGVDKAQIEKRIGRRLDTITPAQMVAIKKIYTSLRDGMSSPGDWFDMSAAESQSSAAEKLKAKQAAKEKKPESKAEPEKLPDIPESLADKWTLLSDELAEGGMDSALELLEKWAPEDQSLLRPHLQRAGEK